MMDQALKIIGAQVILFALLSIRGIISSLIELGTMVGIVLQLPGFLMLCLLNATVLFICVKWNTRVQIINYLIPVVLFALWSATKDYSLPDIGQWIMILSLATANMIAYLYIK